MDKQVLTSSLATEDASCYTVGVLRNGMIRVLFFQFDLKDFVTVALLFLCHNWLKNETWYLTKKQQHS